MAGTVYLRTNRFEVKLEGITFKTKDFESLCAMDFLFPEGKIWARPPIVGLDVMHHPRDPSILLVLLCFGVGCVILKFRSGEALPPQIRKFLEDKRIHFVGFGIPEKKDLFPFQELGLTKSKVDIGYLASRILKDSKCKTWELAQLARYVLGIKRMIGLTEASSFERHEQIKCAICQLFITSVIAMGLMGANDNKNNNKKWDDSPKKNSFLKNLNSLHFLAEGWFKLPKGKKKSQKTSPQLVDEDCSSVYPQIGDMEENCGDDVLVKAKREHIPHFSNFRFQDTDFGDNQSRSKIKMDPSDNILIDNHIGRGHSNNNNKVNLGNCIACVKDGENTSCDDHLSKEASCSTKTNLKGILKCPSTGLQQWNSSPPDYVSPPSTSKDQMVAKGPLKRANSKGCNVSFKCQ